MPTINLCDSLLANDIQGYNCDDPMIKGVENLGILINRSDINLASVVKDAATHEITAMPLISGKKGYQIVQGGNTPFNGTKQEVVVGTYQNTFTNTFQFAILNAGQTTADIVDALANGTFVGVLTNKYAPTGELKNQVYGLDAGLRASEMVRELYNDDTLAGWLVTMTEEGAGSASWYVDDELMATLTETAL